MLRHVVLCGKKLVRSVIGSCADRDHSTVECPERSSGPNVTQEGMLELLIGNQARETELGCVPLTGTSGMGRLCVVRLPLIPH